MTDKIITLTLSENLYNKTKRLVDEGLFTDFDEVLRAGLRHVLLDAAIMEGETQALALTDSERYRFYLHKLRQKIAKAGGLFPGKTPDEIIDSLRQTRDELYEEKYAAHFRQ